MLKKRSESAAHNEQIRAVDYDTAATEKCWLIPGGTIDLWRWPPAERYAPPDPLRPDATPAAMRDHTRRERTFHLFFGDLHVGPLGG